MSAASAEMPGDSHSQAIGGDEKFDAGSKEGNGLRSRLGPPCKVRGVGPLFRGPAVHKRPSSGGSGSSVAPVSTWADPFYGEEEELGTERGVISADDLHYYSGALCSGL